MPASESSIPDAVKPAPPRRGHLLAAAGVFTLIAIYGSLVPLEFKPLAFDEAVRRFRNIEHREFVIQSRTDLVANVLLFVPIGFCWLGFAAVDRSRRVALFVALPLACLLAAVSVSIEFSQLWVPRRTVSTSDILAQSLGAALGSILWITAGQAIVGWARSFFSPAISTGSRHAANSAAESRLHKLMQLYAVGLIAYNLMPLDLTLSIGELHAKFKHGKVVLVPFGFKYSSYYDLVYNVIIDTIVFIPVGALAAKGFLRERPTLRPVLQSVAWGAALVVGIEAAQLFVFSRVTDSTDLLTCTAGIAIGAWLMHRYGAQVATSAEPSRKGVLGAHFWKWLAITCVYMGVLVAIFWAPFEFRFDSKFARPRLERFFEVPFKWLLRGSELKAVTELLRKTLLFGALGALWVRTLGEACVPHTIRRVLLAASLGVCFVLAMGIELGQIVQPSHTPDFSDVMLCTVGATAGLLIGTRVWRSSTE